LEPLAKAPPPEPRKLTDKEQRKLIEQEDDTLRELRIFLRDILSKLGREKKFGIFTKPVDIEEVGVSVFSSCVVAPHIPQQMKWASHPFLISELVVKKASCQFLQKNNQVFDLWGEKNWIGPTR